MIRAVLTDIEGTTTPIAFVHDVLFPYARAHLRPFLAAHAADPEVAAILADVARAQPGPPQTTLLAWMDQDAKVTPLKTLQGLIWRQGYQSGAIRGALYPDVPPQLATWSRDDVALHVYSSGSEEAQRLLFGFSDAGDLCPLFGGFFDTRVGAKREADSYRRIIQAIGCEAAAVLFLSDMEAELDAAAAAGLATCQLVRGPDGTVASSRHKTAASFTAISLHG
jgi:enolase-phosphatase E1